MFNITVKVKKNTKVLKDIEKKLIKASHDAVQVGFFDGKLHPSGDMTIAEVAAIQEFGTREVPERPFMRTTIMKDREFVTYLENGISTIIWGVKPNAKQGLKGAGQVLAEAMKESVETWTTPINSRATVRRKGFNDPLVETGTMRENISWRLVSK